MWVTPCVNTLVAASQNSFLLVYVKCWTGRRPVVSCYISERLNYGVCRYLKYTTGEIMMGLIWDWWCWSSFLPESIGSLLKSANPANAEANRCRWWSIRVFSLWNRAAAGFCAVSMWQPNSLGRSPVGRCSTDPVILARTWSQTAWIRLRVCSCPAALTRAFLWSFWSKCCPSGSASCYCIRYWYIYTHYNTAIIHTVNSQVTYFCLLSQIY